MPMQREVCKYTEGLTGIQLAADSCIKRRRRLVLNFLLTSSSRKLINAISKYF
jgi:hypothetical protein